MTRHDLYLKSPLAITWKVPKISKRRIDGLSLEKIRYIGLTIISVKRPYRIYWHLDLQTHFLNLCGTKTILNGSIISSLEKVGLEGRGGYYDNSGALRDMIQNHMLQLMCMIAMELPISFDADEIRNKKADILHAVRKYSEQEVFQYTARGQDPIRKKWG